MECGWFHKLRQEIRSGLRRSERGDYRAVAVRVTEVRYVCRKCGVEIRPWKQVYRSVINSLTLPGDRMERFERCGYLWD